jgi:hypothetical protein
VTTATGPGDHDAVSVAHPVPSVDHVPGVFGIAQHGGQVPDRPPGDGGRVGRRVPVRVGVEPVRDGGQAELVHGPPGGPRRKRGAQRPHAQALRCTGRARSVYRDCTYDNVVGSRG